MPASLAEMWAEAGAALLIAATLARLCRRLPLWVVIAMLAALVAAAATIRFAGLTGLQYALTLTGTLSAASLALCVRSLVRDLARPAVATDPLGFRVMAVFVLGLIVVLYPAAMGLGAFDPYRLGFVGWQLPAGLLGLLAMAYLLRAPAVALWLGLAGLAFLLHLGPSRNLWDYAIDPLAGLLAIIALLEGRLARRTHRSAAE